MAHLDEATALGYAAGRLAAGEREAALEHVDGCEECRLLVAAAAGGGLRGRAMPDRIGRFLVDAVAGRGAMGIVYRARDPRLDRAVAIKTLRGDAFAGPARARFEREARALARVDHANVVRVYEVGDLDGELYLAMELVDGPTLQDWLAAAPRRPAEIVAVFAQAAEGLLAAHQAGLVHRDFKPANAMIDADGRVRVTDFGLVHLGDGARAAPPADAATGDHELTQTGLVLGTPAYLAPELFAGVVDAAGPEPRSDQFSLCVALYEALAGHRPFEATDLRGLRAAIDRGPLPPRRPIPRRVHRALRRGLAVAPRDRFPSLRELLDAITPPRRARALAVAAAVTVVLAGGAVVAWATTRAPSSPRPAPAAADACPAADRRWAAIWTDQRAASVHAALLAAWPSSPPRNATPQVVERWAGLGRVRARLVVEQVRDVGDAWRSQYRAVCAADDRVAVLRRRCLDDVAARLDAVLAELPGRGLADALGAVDDELDRCATHLVAGLDLPADEARAAVERARLELAAGAALRGRGATTPAAAAIDRALQVGLDTGSPSLLAEAWLEYGLLARDLGEPRRAIDCLHNAVGFAQQVGHQRVLRRTADELAAQYAASGAGAEAERWLGTAAVLDGKVPPTPHERAARLLVRAELARAGGEPARARDHLTEAAALVTDAPESALAGEIARAQAALAP